MERLIEVCWFALYFSFYLSCPTVRDDFNHVIPDRELSDFLVNAFFFIKDSVVALNKMSHTQQVRKQSYKFGTEYLKSEMRFAELISCEKCVLFSPRNSTTAMWNDEWRVDCFASILVLISSLLFLLVGSPCLFYFFSPM